MRTRQNYGWLDRFRVIVALLAITNHTSALSSVSDGADFFLTRVLARIVVPFFFMVTGQFAASAFLYPSNKNGPKLIKYLRKTSLFYALCILIYLPIGIYAKHYQGITFGGILRMLIFDGTFYHLWYFPACIIGMLLVFLMSRRLSLRVMTAITAVLYIIGLFGDSYFGLTQKVPFLNAAYEFGFQIFSYTRNGLFIAPLFLVLGMWMSVLEERRANAPEKNPLIGCIWGLTFSFSVMTIEAFTLRHFELQRHDSMYLALVPTMFFLYQCLLCVPKEPSKICRTVSTWIYILHPGVIVVVRALAKILRQTELLVDNSVTHYLAVTFLSVAASLFIVYLDEKFLPIFQSAKEPKPDETVSHDSVPSGSPLPMSESYKKRNFLLLPQEEYDIKEESPLQEPREEDAPCIFEEGEDSQESEEAFSFDTPSDSQKSSDLFSPALEQNQRRADPPPSQEDTEMSPVSRAWIELDASALTHNVEFLRSRLPQSCRLMPAVKANAYGHGDVLISRLLNRLGVNAFCVACLSEGIQLRKAGIQGEILVLGYTAPANLPLLVYYQLTQAVIDYAYAKVLEQSGHILHVHVAVDTGMHRLGVRCENIEELLAIYKMKHLKIDGIFTHLSASDSLVPSDREFTENQIQAFYQVVNILEHQGYECKGLHMLASYGILNLLPAPEQETRHLPNTAKGQMPPSALAADYVRPGIALYGLLSTEDDYNLWWDYLRPVLSLKARVVSVRALYEGEAAGYGLAYTASHDMRIATLSIGYADGLPRELSHGKGSVLIDGYRAPIIGRVCMDQTIVDISNIPKVQAGDIAVLIGKSGIKEITAGQVAGQCGTITNELLSRLGTRLERITISQ